VSELRVLSVSLARFRNHATWSSELDGRLTILVGQNAAGKTNILEAMMVTATGGSFRSFSWEDLVKTGEGDALVAVRAARDGAPIDVSLRVESSGGREYSLNGRRRRRLSDVVGRIPMVSFVPEDLSMSKGPPEARRTPIDALGDRLSPAYSAIRLEYGRLVRQRNALLRQGAPDDQLEPWDEMVAAVGASLTLHRTRLLARMERPTIEAYERVSEGERLTVGYKANWADATLEPATAAEMQKDEMATAIAAALRERRSRERERGSTLAGPHRDDVALFIGGHAVRTYASQGQHRTAALAWKMAEVAVVAEVAGVRPLLLLDDVMSELDEKRRTALAEYVLAGPQAIVTTTNLSYFASEMLDIATVVRVGDE
jgi:DNA replication and repair protein RecF